MAIYKNYVLKQGDTVEGLAQKYLGGISRASDIIALNRLRYPYISDDSYQKLGPPVASGSLNIPIQSGDTSVNVGSYIANGTLAQSALSKQSVFFLRTIGFYGAIIQDRLSIKGYYPYSVTELSSDGVTYNVVPAGTLQLDTPVISPPSTSAFDEGMLSVENNAVFIGSIAGNILTVDSVSSGHIAIGMQIHNSNILSPLFVTAYLNVNGDIGTYQLSGTTNVSSDLFIAKIPSSATLASRNYYVRYSYESLSGETLAGPLRTEESNGAAIPVALTSFSAGLKQLLVVSAPVNWPNNVVGIKIYIGLSPNTEVHQGTFTKPTDFIIEPVSGFTFLSSGPPKINTATLGFLNSYSIGTRFSIHENPDALNTQVLGTGDTILLPALVPPRSQLIVNSALSNQFIDELGTDIKLDANGRISFDGSAGVDLTTISGIANVKQSIKGRLVTRINELRTQPRFGNYSLNQLGTKYSPNFLLIIETALIETLKKEPRISSINSIKVRYDARSGSVVINNLSIRITYEGTSASDITFDPIALPI